MTKSSHAPGSHLLIDHYGSPFLSDAATIERALRAAAEAAQATVLHVRIHSFPGRGGITGVALLAESHISIHTWPEMNYAALDVFMCGLTDAERACEVLAELLEPEQVEITRVQRGQRQWTSAEM